MALTKFLLADAFVRLSAKDQKLADALERNGKRLGRLSQLASRAASAIAALFAVRTAQALFRALSDVADEMDRIAKAARKLGVSEKALVALQFAAGREGIAEGTINTAIQRMIRRVAEAARGMGEARDVLRELNLDARRLNKQNPAQTFREIIAALQQLPRNDRIRAAFKIFDTEGVDLIRLTIATLDEARIKVEETGLAFGRSGSAGAQKFQDTMQDLRAEMTGLGRDIATEVLPRLNQMLDALADGDLLRVLEILHDTPSDVTKASTDLLARRQARKENASSRRTVTGKLNFPERVQGLIDQGKFDAAQKEIDHVAGLVALTTDAERRRFAASPQRQTSALPDFATSPVIVRDFQRRLNEAQRQSTSNSLLGPLLSGITDAVSGATDAGLQAAFSTADALDDPDTIISAISDALQKSGLPLLFGSAARIAEGERKQIAAVEQRLSNDDAALADVDRQIAALNQRQERGFQNFGAADFARAIQESIRSNSEEERRAAALKKLDEDRNELLGKISKSLSRLSELRASFN